MTKKIIIGFFVGVAILVAIYLIKNNKDKKQNKNVEGESFEDVGLIGGGGSETKDESKATTKVNIGKYGITNKTTTAISKAGEKSLKKGQTVYVNFAEGDKYFLNYGYVPKSDVDLVDFNTVVIKQDEKVNLNTSNR